MATANQELFDASVRHQVALRRFATGEANRVLQILEQADRDLTRQLRERLAKMGGVRDFTSERLQRLLADVRAARVETMKAAREAARDDLVGLSKQEATFETRLLKASIPIQIDLAAVSLTNLRQLVTRELIEGRTLGQWFSSIERADRTRIEAAVQQGIVQGLSIPDIVARVSGTRANNFTDGALAMTRRQAETVVRTAVNHVSNSAREEVWEANSDIILALRWTATLDGRTSAICRARDGKLAPVGDKPLPAGSDALDPPGARPPAHPNCRSVMIAVTDADGIVGSRPFVTDTRTREEREIDFRKMAREQERPISEIRKEWAERNVGTLPAGTTYEEWLRRQSAEFQDDVLGAEKGRLFREEGLRLDQFVDSSGRELSLEELGAAPPAPVTKAVDAFPVAQDVRERMEAIRSVPEDLNLRDEFGPGGGLEDHRASYFIREWTESTDFISKDVARIVDGTATPRMVKSAADQTIGEGEIDPKNFEAGVKEYYAWTQRGLEEKGLDEYVTLYRGVRSDQAAEIGKAVLSGKEGDIQISLSGLSSFTTDRKIAESFGSVVIEYRAHRSRIFASYLTDRNLIGEREVVVLSGKDPISLSKERLAISANARWGFKTWQDVVSGDGGEL